jgi:hypothetical protein
MARFIEPKKASNERPRGPEKDFSEGVDEGDELEAWAEAGSGIAEDV